MAAEYHYDGMMVLAKGTRVPAAGAVGTFTDLDGNPSPTYDSNGAPAPLKADSFGRVLSSDMEGFRADIPQGYVDFGAGLRRGVRALESPITAEEAQRIATETATSTSAELVKTYPTRTEVAEALTGDPVAVTDLTVDQVLADPASASNARLSSTIAGEARAASARALTAPGVKAPKPILVFIDDDGKSATYDVTRAIFNAKGKKFTFAPTTSNVGTAGHMTLAQIKELQAEGHEVSSHHETHVGIADLTEIGDSHKWFQDNGLNVRTLTWVGGEFNDAAINEAKKFYTCATSVVRGSNLPPVDQFALKRYAVGSMWSNSTHGGTIMEDGSQTQYNAMVDKAKAEKSLVIAMMHNWDPQFDATQQDRVRAMIDYADAQGVEILTLSEAMEFFANAVDVGTTAGGFFRVGANGKVSAPALDSLAYRVISPTEITSTTPGTSFPVGQVSVATFKSNSGSGFPRNNAGTLETFYLADQYTVFQRWTPFDGATTWFRTFNHVTLAWRPWRALSQESSATVLINVAAQTVNPGAVVEVRLTHPDAANMVNTDTIIASPVGGLETGLMHSVATWTDKTIIIRLHNPTAAAITTAARNWRVKALAE